MEITTGSVDQDVLAGNEAGKALCEFADGHYWLESALKGITDGGLLGSGRRFLKGSNSEEIKD